MVYPSLICNEQFFFPFRQSGVSGWTYPTLINLFSDPVKGRPFTLGLENSQEIIILRVYSRFESWSIVWEQTHQSTGLTFGVVVSIHQLSCISNTSQLPSYYSTVINNETEEISSIQSPIHQNTLVYFSGSPSWLCPNSWPLAASCPKP